MEGKNEKKDLLDPKDQKVTPKKPRKKSSSNVIAQAGSLPSDPETDEKLKELGLKKIWLNVTGDYELV